MSDVMMSFLNRIKNDEMTVMADAGMRFPKSDPFEHGVQVGRYQGLLKAVEVLEELINEQANADRDL